MPRLRGDFVKEVALVTWGRHHSCGAWCAEPAGEGIGQPFFAALPDPGDVAIGTHQHRGGRLDIPQVQAIAMARDSAPRRSGRDPTMAPSIDACPAR